MRRAGSVLLALGAMAFVLVSAAAGATGGARVPVSVKPAIGAPSAKFTVSFRVPHQTGSPFAGGRRYELSASGPSGRHCGSSASTAVGPTRAGQWVQVRLSPAEPARNWCRGRYSGRLIEMLTPRCPPREACPALIAVMDVGNFSFRVR